MSRILLSSFESMEEPVLNENHDPVDVSEIIVNLDRVNESSQNLENSIYSVEEALDTIETMQEITGVVGGTIENGGMSQAPMQAVNAAMEHLLYTLTHQRNNIRNVSLEGFGNETTRVKATQIAVESFGEKIKAVLRAIMDAVKKVLSFIKDFFTKVSVVNQDIRKIYADLNKKAEDLISKGYSTDTSVQVELDESHICYLRTKDNASVDEFNNIVENIIKGPMGGVVDEIKTYANGISSVLNKMSMEINMDNRDDSGFNEIVKKAFKNNGKAKDELVSIETQELGNCFHVEKIGLNKDVSDENLEKAMSSLSIKVKKDDKVTGDVNLKAKPLSLKEISHLNIILSKHFEDLLDVDKHKRFLDNVEKSLEKLIDNYVSFSKETKVDTNSDLFKDRIKQIRSTCSIITKVVVNFYKDYYTYYMHFHKALTTYAKLSLKSASSK